VRIICGDWKTLHGRIVWFWTRLYMAIRNNQAILLLLHWLRCSTRRWNNNNSDHRNWINKLLLKAASTGRQQRFCVCSGERVGWCACTPNSRRYRCIFIILMCVLYSKIYTYGVLSRCSYVYVFIIALLIHIIIRNVCRYTVCTIQLLWYYFKRMLPIHVSPLSYTRTELKIYIHRSIVCCQ